MNLISSWTLLVLYLNHAQTSFVYENDRKSSRKDRTWSQSLLTYTLLGDQIPSFDYTLIHKTVQNAFFEWSRYSPYRFIDMTPFKIADIKVVFARDEVNKRGHECNRNFNGNPAHAFFLTNRRYRGQIHVNLEYLWLESSIKGSVSLKTILLHEIGHVLGLEHSFSESSIMYPFVYTNSIKSISKQDQENILVAYKEKIFSTLNPKH